MKEVKFLRTVCATVSVCVIVLITLSVTVVAAEDDEKIKVGYFASFTDLIYDISYENFTGYGYEIFQKIEEISDLTFEFVPIEGDLVQAVLNDTVDVAGFAIRTDYRKDEVIFSALPYGKTYAALMTDNMDIRYDSPSSIDGKTVATYDDNYAQQYLDEYCRQNGISVNYVYGEVNNYMDYDADFQIVYSEDRYATAGNNVLNLGVFNLYLMTSIENEDIIAEIDEVFYQIVNTEGNFFLELEEKYLSDNLEINHRSLTEEEVEVLRQRPLEVGYIADYQPISFKNEQGNPDGAMVEVLNHFAERYGFEVNYHPYSLSTDKEQYENFDILLTMYGESEHLGEHYDSTESYYDIPMYAQVHQDTHHSSTSLDEMIGASNRIGLLPYLSIDFDALLEDHPSSEVVLYEDWYELLDDYEDGDVDMIIHTQSATSYVELHFGDSDRVAVRTDIENPMQILISKDISEAYLPIFNIMLDRLTQNDYEEMVFMHANNYFPKTTLLDYFQKYWYQWIPIVFIAVGIMAGIAIHKEREKQKALINAYNTDPLTGLTAFHRFREIIEETAKIANEGEYEVMSLDVDMFKTINTHFSPQRGNEVILAISDALKKVFENTSATISRRTSDLFLILRKVDEGGTIRDIYNNHILTAIRAVLGEKYNISMSFGNVIITSKEEKSSSLIGKADNARSQGKGYHKTTFTTFDSEMQKIYEDKINITFRMEQALKDREFFVEYQPQIDFKTLKVGGAEVLVRWAPRLGEKIYPDEFIPIFEDNGFIATLDLFVFEELCKFIKANFRKMSIPCISVNLSAHTILSENVLLRISDIITTYEIEPEKIELELTESAVEKNTDIFMKRVSQFKKMGFSIAIDDFGAGVSSLNRLSAIEADVLKLDKAFFDVKGMGKRNEVVVSDIIAMAKHLNMKVVAEGVETESHVKWLQKINCDYAQGYFFARSMGEDAFKELLLSGKVFEATTI